MATTCFRSAARAWIRITGDDGDDNAGLRTAAAPTLCSMAAATMTSSIPVGAGPQNWLHGGTGSDFTIDASPAMATICSTAGPAMTPSTPAATATTRSPAATATTCSWSTDPALILLSGDADNDTLVGAGNGTYRSMAATGTTPFMPMVQAPIPSLGAPAMIS